MWVRTGGLERAIGTVRSDKVMRLTPAQGVSGLYITPIHRVRHVRSAEVECQKVPPPPISWHKLMEFNDISNILRFFNEKPTA